jgi:hypothetical protein
VTDVQRLLEAFERGELVRPNASMPNTVDLARAMASLCGVPGVSLSENAIDMVGRIGDRDHIVFVLVDGLGMNVVDREDAAGFLRTNLQMELQSVFPSSTAPALTSIATGCWPAEHAVPGWWTYLPDAGITATILPFIERYSKTSARRRGADPSTAYPAEAVAPRMTRQRLRVMPQAIAESVYSAYSSGDAPVVAYQSLREAVDAIYEEVSQAGVPAYVYFYIPFVDATEHDRGPDHPEVKKVLRRVTDRLVELVDRVNGRARVVVTADHGVIEIPEECQTRLADEDPLLELLEIPPSCEPRVPAFHVKRGRHAEFEQLFRDRFGERFALLTSDEADNMRLFGPMSLSGETRRRLGDYIGMALGNYSLAYRPDTDTMIGFHGGCHPDEMRVPLIIA